MCLFTEWEGWMGVDIWLEVHVSWPRAKYFPVQLDLTQSIRIFIIRPLCLNFYEGANIHQSVCFSSSAACRTFFSYGFPTKLYTGPFRSHDKNLCTFFFHHYCVKYLCPDRGLSFSCFIVVVFFSSFLVVHCCGMTLFCLSLFHFTGTTKKSEVSKAARRHKDSNKQIRQ